jgi:GTP cyclohydrolase III
VVIIHMKIVNHTDKIADRGTSFKRSTHINEEKHVTIQKFCSEIFQQKMNQKIYYLLH